jgi:hypothetical protein
MPCVRPTHGNLPRRESAAGHLLKGILEERGIATWVVNDSIQMAGGELPLGWTAAAQVVVGEDDAVEARQFAEDFDARTSHEPTPDTEGEAKVAEWDDWPTCPECQQKRAIRCPVCGVSGTDFALADVQETETGPRVLLMCEDCDDHFRPEMFRRCHHCGHDYGEGYEVETAVAPIIDAANRRVWLLLAGLVIGTVLLLAYFALLVQRPA